MIKDSFNAIGDAARGLFRNWRGLALLNALYLALLVSFYVFFATGVANAWQLTLTALAALAAPLLFFVLQAAVANFAQGDAGFGALARRSLRDFLKVVLLSLPVIALAFALVWLLYKVPGWLPKVAVEASPHAFAPSAMTAKPEPIHWQDAFVSTLWLLLLGIFLPLLAAHLWLSAARDGLAATLKRIHRVTARAFAPQSLLIYVVGLFVFGLMPYFVLFTRTPVSNGWVELLLFGLRLALAFVFTLWGWTITLGALARTTPTPDEIVSMPVPAESAAASDVPAESDEARGEAAA
ncbi:MAG: hypothetical protein H7Z38_02005 [Rubrivivax sp.]|nr:hypothetical protein [Pyrinomonadaceae bacterium]